MRSLQLTESDALDLTTMQVQKQSAQTDSFKRLSETPIFGLEIGKVCNEYRLYICGNHDSCLYAGKFMTEYRGLSTQSHELSIRSWGIVGSNLLVEVEALVFLPSAYRYSGPIILKHIVCLPFSCFGTGGYLSVYTGIPLGLNLGLSSLQSTKRELEDKMLLIGLNKITSVSDQLKVLDVDFGVDPPYAFDVCLDKDFCVENCIGSI